MAGQFEVQSAQVVAYFVAKSVAEIVAQAVEDLVVFAVEDLVVQAVACVVLPRLMSVEAGFGRCVWTQDVKDVFLGGQDMSNAGGAPRGQHVSTDPRLQLGRGPPAGPVTRTDPPWGAALY